uniref:Replication protein A 70 kDa DNA-binding subunit B n=1 Tax=Tanacetum cinerariifolium TaxID=118510 RepID=A0A6L2KXA9_TANCI|nr:replication protein A 70 kDa DNA-binding subunit B [Tanacetum cinerariifolium]
MDTIGAYDSFIGALLTKIVDDQSMLQLIYFNCKSSRLQEFHGMVPAFPVKEMDIGAYDSFIGALLTKIVDDQSMLQDEAKLKDILRYLCACCHEPNFEGSGSAWKAYMNARVAGLFFGKLPLLPHKYKISFYKGTVVTRIDPFDENLNDFILEPFNRLFDGTRYYHKHEAVDVIGSVVEIGDVDPVKSATGQKIQRTVVIKDSEKVKSWDGTPSIHNALFGTKMFINRDFPEIEPFRQRFKELPEYDENQFKISVFTPQKPFVTSASFIDNIRRYNSMFAFNSMGDKQNTSVNVGRVHTATDYMAYINARVAGLFLLVLLEYPNGKGVLRVTSRDSIWHYTGRELGPLP